MQIIQNVFQPVMTVDRIEADEDANRFRLKATGGGFLANLIGMGTKATITADASGVRIQKTTFGMDENVFVPRAHIAATVRIVAKPLELLVLGLVLLPFFGVGLVFFVIYLFSKKRITVGVASTAGTVESVKLKANEESLEDIRAGMRLVEGMLGNTDPAAGAVGSPDASGDRTPARGAAPAPARNLFPPPPAGDDTFVVACGNCGTQMNAPAAAEGKRIRCGSCREVFVATRG